MQMHLKHNALFTTLVSGHFFFEFYFVFCRFKKIMQMHLKKMHYLQHRFQVISFFEFYFVFVVLKK